MVIVKNGAFIDFYINKRKYESLKTERGRYNYVYRELNKLLSSLTGKVVEGVEIREVSITSNDFWGNDITFVNDIGYCYGNELPLNEDKLTVRSFFINILGVLQKEVKTNHYFFNIKDKHFEIQSASSKLI